MKYASTVGSSAASRPRRRSTSKLRAPCPVRNSFSVSSNSRAGGTPPSSSRSGAIGAAVAGSMLKAELRLEARRAQHAHRILAKARLRIADQPQRARRDVLRAADVVPEREVGDVVVERIGGEVAPPDILVDRAVDVVAQDAPGGIEAASASSASASPAASRDRPAARSASGLGVSSASSCAHRAPAPRRPRDPPPAAAHRPARRARRPKRRHLDDLAPEEHVRQTEAPADQAAVAEQPLHLLGQRIGGDVEILRLDADQQVAHAAADQKCHEARHRAGDTARAVRWAKCGSGRSSARIAG